MTPPVTGYRTAVHEAGHWVVAEALGFRIDAITACGIRPDIRGLTRYQAADLPPDPPANPWVHGKGSQALWDTPWRRRRRLEAEIAIALAGDIAASLLAGEGPTRSADDDLADRLALDSGLTVTASLVEEGASLGPLPGDEDVADHLARLLVDETAGALVALLRIATRQLVDLYAPTIRRRAALLLDVGSVRIPAPSHDAALRIADESARTPQEVRP